MFQTDCQMRNSALSSQLYDVEFPSPCKPAIPSDIVAVLKIASDSVPIWQMYQVGQEEMEERKTRRNIGRSYYSEISSALQMFHKVHFTLSNNLFCSLFGFGLFNSQ